jgi:hypothetical protein
VVLQLLISKLTNTVQSGPGSKMIRSPCAIEHIMLGSYTLCFWVRNAPDVLIVQILTEMAPLAN